MASDQSLLDWLSGPFLTELGESVDVKGDLPRPLPAAFYAPGPANVVGLNVMWDAVPTGQRQGSLFSDPNSPSNRVETQARTRRFANAMGLRENFGLDAEFMMYLQSNIPLFQQRAKVILQQKMQDFRLRQKNLWTNMVHSVISQGNIYADKSGNLLPSSTNYLTGVNYLPKYMGAAGTPLDPSQQGQLIKTTAWPNVSGVTVGDWSSASTDIELSLRAMKDAYLYTTNRRIGGVIYGRKIPGYFANNTSMQTFMSRNQTYGGRFLDTNEVPAGMMDLNWINGHEAYWQDQNNANQQWFADNSITLIPEPSQDWYEAFECSLPVPNGVPFAQSMAGVESVSSMFPVVKGYSSYCYGRMDPVDLTCVQQWFGLPVVKSPLAAWSILVS